MTKSLRLAILISGGGSNLQAIIDAIESGILDAEITAVVSNNPSARGLLRASRHSLDARVIDHRDYDDRGQYEVALRHYLESVAPDYIVLAGFMRILGVELIQAFEDRILNIHPSLLPNYKGLDTYRRALDNNEKKHGVSIHLVTDKLDDGPIIMQASYPVETGDSVEDLQAKGLPLEHRMYPQVLRWLSEEKLTIKGGRIFYEQTPIEQPIVFNS